MSSSASSPSDIPVPLKKRRKASSSSSSTPENSPKRPSESPQQQPATMTLPPPLMPYPAPPPPHMAVPHPYYPFYPPPFYLPVSPHLPPKNPGKTPILPKGTDIHRYYPYPPVPPPAAVPTPTTAPQDTTADQREQARKLSHSAIERRRRERINDKIIQLRQLIPSCADQEHLHKMTVLQSAIDYITYLKDVVARLDGGQDRVNANLKIKNVPKSMMPKEVEPFTSQFSVNSIKPLDILQAKVPLASSKQAKVSHEDNNHEDHEEEEATAEWSLPPPCSSGQQAPSDAPASPTWQDDPKLPPPLPSPALTPRPNGMSIKNILC